MFHFVDGAAETPIEWFHDTEAWVCGGVKIYGRLVSHGVARHQFTKNRRTGRRGVNADYVDSQYHGRLEE